MSTSACLIATALLAAHFSSNAALDATDPERTIEPLRHLLQSSSQLIPKKSTCFGHYGQRGDPRIQDLLASRLAYLHNGQNVISGTCTAKRCELEIRHSAGEDIASATISFKFRHGVINSRTLSCVLTP